MNKLVTYGLATLSVSAIVGAASLSVSAYNGQGNTNGARTGTHQGQGGGYGYQKSLETRAKIFGVTVDDLKEALKTKTMSQIAVEKGLSEDDFRTKMTEAAESRWKERGLSDEQIAERMADRKARQEANSADHEFGSGEGERFGGYGRNR